MSELFSEIGQNGTPYIRPEVMNVIKATNRDYPAYWNEEKQKWGGLLEATIYTENSSLPTLENSEVVSYRKLTGIEK